MRRWPVAILLALLLTGPGVPGLSAPAPGRTLRIGLESQPTTMDAGLSTDLYSSQVYSSILEGLLMLDPSGVPDRKSVV